MKRISPEVSQPVPNILVVDDTPANLNLLSGMLKKHGYRVRPVPSGKLALQAIQSETPDLILLDIKMPEMDGYEVCEKLKADITCKDIPILFISALSETEDKIKAFATGCVDYITKPFQFEEVEARVRTHLELRRLQMKLEAQNAALKTAQEKTRQNESLLNSLFGEAPFGVMVVDEDLTLKVVNHAAQLNLGSTPPEPGAKLNEMMEETWAPQVAKRLIARFRKTLATGISYTDSNFRERRKDTREMESYEWLIKRLPLADGQCGTVAFFNNVTARHQVERAKRRMEILTASNIKFREQIVQRLSVEKSLRAAKREQASLLKKSDRQQKRLRDLSRRILHAQELERKHISRELHDVVVQSLIGISFQLAIIGKTQAGDPQRFQESVERAKQLLKDSTDIVHSFSRELRPTMLDDLGLGPAVETLLHHFSRDTGIQCNLRFDDSAGPIEGDYRTILYRVVQEASANVHRHAKASQLDLVIETNADDIRMQIVDNGKGFKANSESIARKKGRLGLLGMRERVEMVGGCFHIESKPGVSTSVLVEIPIPKAGLRAKTDAAQGSSPLNP